MAKTKVIKRVEPKAPIHEAGAAAERANAVSFELRRLTVRLRQCEHYRDNAKTRGNPTATHYWETKVETIRAQMVHLETGDTTV